MLMQTGTPATPRLSLAAIDDAVDHAVRAIPPLWPLSSSVAVNPFLGQSHEPLAVASARLARVAGLGATMPRSFYRAHVASGRIAEADLAAALDRSTSTASPPSLDALKASMQADGAPVAAIPTVADLAARVSGVDWPSLVAERFGAWAASYFDEGQALWSAPKDRGAFAAWRWFATRDLTPEIAGLRNFARHVASLPEHPQHALADCVARLAIPEGALETYLHALLMSLGGYAQYGRHILWKAELDGGDDPVMRDLLAIRLMFEDALYAQFGTEIESDWRAACAAHAAALEPAPDQVLDSVLQEAFDRAAQRELAARFATAPNPARAQRPRLQAAFCIDVRSEVFRRNLESVSGDVETIGFAGFFGLALSHRSFASDVDEARCPVLLKPSLRTCSGVEAADSMASDARIGARAVRAWGRFKLAAVSSFAFVEAMGPVYVGKLLRDALNISPGHRRADPAPQPDPAMTLAQKAAAAEAILRAMSLTDNFARVVLLAGHGAHVANNPHASALACGACGGYSGEANARLLAALLNDREVRAALKERIEIPDDTVFIAALHDTTSDDVRLYDLGGAEETHAQDLALVRDWMSKAGALARAERALRLPGTPAPKAVAARGRNWAEVRPEWGLAGCNAFIAAPRARTAGMKLDGRAFLHSYDWRQDANFSVLELILTAPVVVASWISLQYFGSVVAPSHFGGGNKLLHNVVGGVGVVEGNGGLLRAGLPWQSVHDGAGFVHEPLRLSVVIEAPVDAINGVLAKHPEVAKLFDNGWLALFAMDETGRLARRYACDGSWEKLTGEGA